MKNYNKLFLSVLLIVGISCKPSGKETNDVTYSKDTGSNTSINNTSSTSETNDTSFESFSSSSISIISALPKPSEYEDDNYGFIESYQSYNFAFEVQWSTPKSSWDYYLSGKGYYIEINALSATDKIGSYIYYSLIKSEITSNEGTKVVNFTAIPESDFKTYWGESSVYKIRAYLKHPQGKTITFSPAVIYRKPGIPYVNTTKATNITSTSATLNGSVGSRGGLTFFRFNYSAEWSGIVYKTQDILLIVDPFEGASVSTDVFNLTPNTTYNFRIYAWNSAKNKYGDELTFTTKNGSTKVISENNFPCTGESKVLFTYKPITGCIETSKEQAVLQENGLIVAKDQFGFELTTGNYISEWPGTKYIVEINSNLYPVIWISYDKQSLMISDWASLGDLPEELLNPAFLGGTEIEISIYKKKD